MYLVGKVLKPIGLKGEVKVAVITSFPEHFKDLESVYIKDKEDFKPVRIKQARLAKQFAYLLLEGIAAVEDAEKIRNAEIYIREEQLARLNEGEYYVHDLVGMQVVDEQNQLIGHITNVELAISNDNYEVTTLDGKKHLIPAIREIVKQVDVKNRQMTIFVMEGLLE